MNFRSSENSLERDLRFHTFLDQYLSNNVIIFPHGRTYRLLSPEHDFKGYRWFLKIFWLTVKLKKISRFQAFNWTKGRTEIRNLIFVLASVWILTNIDFNACHFASISDFVCTTIDHVFDWSRFSYASFVVAQIRKQFIRSPKCNRGKLNNFTLQCVMKTSWIVTLCCNGSISSFNDR